MDTNNHTGYAQVVLERLPQPAGDPTHVRDYIVGDDVLGHVDASGAQPDVVQSYIYDGHWSVRGVAALASDPTAGWHRLRATDFCSEKSVLHHPSFAPRSCPATDIASSLDHGQPTEGW